MYPNLTIAKNKRATTHLSKQMICFYTTKIKKFSLFPFCTLAIRNLFFSYFKFDLFSSLRKKGFFWLQFSIFFLPDIHIFYTCGVKLRLLGPPQSPSWKIFFTRVTRRACFVHLCVFSSYFLPYGGKKICCS